MAKRKTNRNIPLEIIGVIIFIMILILGYGKSNLEDTNEVAKDNIVINTVTAEETQNVELTGDEQIQIHFFDVGQADSILLISNGKTMLIDAGTNKEGTTVVKDIKNLGIEKIDYLIGTHPHEDHIGRIR